MRLTNSLPDLHSHRRNRLPETDTSQLHLQPSHFHPPSFSSDDFLDQIFPSIPPPWELHAGLSNPQTDLPPQIGDTIPAAKMSMAMFHQQLLSAADSGLLPFPGNDVVEADDSSSFECPNPIIGDGSVFPSLFNELAGFLNQSQGNANLNSNSNSNLQKQSLEAPISVNTTPPASGGSAAVAQPRQRVRARRGQATDPHSIAERLRRERIAERMKALQELVPNANKTDKASMLDEIIDYLKFLQLQVKVLSMSRLGGATTALPSQLQPDTSPQGGNNCNQSNRTSGSASAGAPSSEEAMTVTENQVVKLMEEDMGSAMQYLQGKGLCLMPISLATAISTATSHTRHITPPNAAADCPTSPTMSALTVQSTVNHSTSVSRP